MRRKPIFHLAPDLFEQMRKEYGYHLPLTHVRYTDFPGVQYVRVIIPLKSSDNVASILRTPKGQYQDSVNDFLQKKHPTTFIALLCGILPYNTECSLRVYEHASERPEEPQRRIASVVSGKLSETGMVHPHTIHKEYCVAPHFKEITEVFYRLYRSLYFSGVYSNEIMDTFDTDDAIESPIRFVENDEDEYLNHFTTLKKPSR